MSQAGKVLHLYVEVRSVSEEDEKVLVRGDKGADQLMLQCPDVLPNSQRSSVHSSPNRSPDLSPVMTRHSDGGNYNLSPSKSSRHSVSFQLQNPHASGPPARCQHQDLLEDSFGQLLDVLVPRSSGSGRRGPLGRTCSPDEDPCHEKLPVSRSSTPCWLTVPSPTSSSCSSSEDPETVDESGKTSVVSFGYIEKSSVRSTAGRLKTDRTDGKLLPDPVWYQDEPSTGDRFLHHPPRTSSTHGPPHLSRGTMDAVARGATHRALEDFGSPQLRRRFAGHSSENSSPTLPPRCRSWGGSPVPSRSARTLPSKTDLQELDRRLCCSSMNGLPRSPASDRLSAQAGDSVPSVSTSWRHGPTQTQQRHWVTEDSRRTSTNLGVSLPAGRPTDIQHESPTRSFHTSSSSRMDHQTSLHSVRRRGSSRHAAERLSCSSNEGSNPQSLHHSSRCSSRTSEADDRRSISPSSHSDLDCRSSGESNPRSSFFPGSHTPSPTPSQTESLRSESPKTWGPFAKESFHWQSSIDPLEVDHQNHKKKPERPSPQTRPGRISPLMSQKGSSTPASPSLPSRLHRVPASQSPVLDPRHKRCSSPSKDGSALNRYQPPQYTGDRDLLDGSRRCSPEVTRRHPSSQSPEGLPVSWTFRQQDLTGAEPVQDCQQPARVNVQRKGERWNRDAQSTLQDLVLGLEQSRTQREAQDHSGTTGLSSQSSSGVTGSLGDSLSTETSSQSSPGSPDRDSEMQSNGGSAPAASSRSQKIARAKWEFLFGSQTEDRCRSNDAPSSQPPPGATPSSSLQPQPANHRRGRDHRGQQPSHHEVRQIEVELVAPVPRGPASKTGIIRRSIKYSETDLDAVPLRCYQETDLDEVMRAEAEAAEEVDSAFGSNRSVLGNSFSPEDASQKPQPGTRKEVNGEEEDEDEEDEEEEGVVSWASVRMQGDRQRRRAAEEEEVLSLLLKGRTLEASPDVHGGLKSPVSLGSPRRPSDSNLDSFSRHFESIMESHRAKGTSYSSLDSVDLLTSGSTSVFTFDLPTLTPEIQSQICESAKQIIELSFAPLARSDPTSRSETSRSELTLCVSGAGLRGGSKEELGPPVRSRSVKESWRRSILKEGFRKASSVPSLHSSRERPMNRPPELLYPQPDVAERLALSSSDDTMTNGVKPDLQAAKRLAKRLYNLDGFKKSDVARHLSKNNEFSQVVAQEYLSHFNFSGLTIDQALRTFLTQFALMGETQERERVLEHFSRRYRQCNPESLSTEDCIHTLTCAVMLLNSDLHGNNVGKRMSCSQFISNLEGLNDGKDFPKDLLKTLYSSIKNEKLQWTIDEEELRKSVSELAEVRTDSASHTMKRLGSGGNPLMGVAQQADGELYKSGFLVRKVHADPDGKRTPRGKRGWKSFYALLKGLVLYLQKDEYRSERDLTEEDLRNSVSVHHSLAMRAADYSKRPNVFYLRTADWRVFLFQAPNPEQMQSWITRINVVAAMFSAPPFPAAIGSQKRFSRPLLPGSNTKLSQEEQLKSHENRFRAVSSELVDVTTATPDRKVKGRELEEQKLRKEYLEFEKTRYGTYAMLLRAKMASGDEDLSAFESRLFNDGGLQRAHSSPSLPQDAANKEKTRGAKTSKSLKVTPSSSLTTKSSGGTKEGGKKNDNENNKRAELQKQSSNQEEAA